MQATIYVTEEALATANAIKDLTYYERLALSDDPAGDLSQKEGYYLKNANQLNIASLPPAAIVALHLVPENAATYRQHVSMPATLRGCLFEKAPHLPERYAEIVTYWSGEPVNTHSSGAVYFQNPLNEYMVKLPAENPQGSAEAIAVAPVAMDRLLSEGVVVCITDVKRLTANLSLHHFIEIEVPVSPSMLGLEQEAFRSEKAYPDGAAGQCESIWLKVADILASPDPDRIYIDLIRHELLDYGYYY